MVKDYAVSVEHLVKSIEGIDILKSCDLRVDQGVSFGILGANGAGKTTLFKVLTGLLSPTAGTVRVLGQDVTSNRDQILAQIGSMIEVPIFYEHLSAKENLSIHLSYMGQVPSLLQIDWALEQVGLVNTGKQAVSKFSLGMRQRLGIARAIVHKPKLLILDEPTNGLDPMGILEMRQLFDRLVTEEGMTLLISSHILSEIEQITSQICLIKEGRTLETISIDQIKALKPEGLEAYFFEMMKGAQYA